MSPWPDRTVDEWKQEITEDFRLITRYITWALDPELADDNVKQWALAAKEARRLQSDVYRMAAKAGVTREQIDAVGPL